MAAPRTAGMVVIAALSLFVGVSSLMGSGAVISDGLGLSRVGTVTGAPYVGSTGTPPPTERLVNPKVVAFGAVRGILSGLLIAGAIGTLWVRRSARRCSLAYAVGWIVLGIVEPLALGYVFGWPVVISAIFPFLLLMVFNSPSWRAAFAGGPPAAPDRGAA